MEQRLFLRLQTSQRMNLGWFGEGCMFRKPSNLQIGIFTALFGILVVCLVGVLFFTQDHKNTSQYATILYGTNPYVETYIVETSTEIVRIDRRLTLTAKIQTIESHIDKSNTLIARTQTPEVTPHEN